MRKVINDPHNVVCHRIERNVSDVDLASWRRYPFPAGRPDSFLASDVLLNRKVDPIQRRSLDVDMHSSVIAPGILGFLVIDARDSADGPIGFAAS